MAGFVGGFTKAMEESLRKNRVFIVTNLMNVEGVMDHLVDGDVFTDTEDVFTPNEPRKEKIRHLLDALTRRPARDYWMFVKSLYHDSIKQGHIADKILTMYVEKGGTIPTEVVILQRDYRDRRQRREIAGSSARSPPHQGPAQLPFNFQPPTADHPIQPPNNQPGLSLRGNPVSMPSEGGDARQPEGMDIDSDSQGSQPQRMNVNVNHHGSQPQGSTVADQASGGASNESLYSRKKREKREEIYKMESDPRGMALIIDNENFENAAFKQRVGSHEDQESLRNLLENLGYDVLVKGDRKKEEMLDDLKTFSQNEQLGQVDACIVAVMSHGADGGKIFGTDGRVDSNGCPVSGTYITDIDMREFFTSSHCPKLKGKPKFFIVQACRGVNEDTDQGRQPIRRDIVVENSENQRSPDYTDESNYLDMCWAYATIEGMVAYRHTFIQKLTDIFTENAATSSFDSMMRKLVSEMGTNPLRDGERKLFTIPDDKRHMKKKWYFNPPSASS